MQTIVRGFVTFPSVSSPHHASHPSSTAMALIADEDKQEYLEASRLVPHLVATESNPLRFLRSDGMNPWSAATRLCSYWKHRKEVFGHERWLLPLDLSGNGAMTPSDVENIKRNVILLRRLPGAPTVIYCNYGRAPNQDELFASRAAFFTAMVVTPDECDTGVYLMHQLAPQFFMRRRKKGRVIEILRRALPVKIRKMFFLKQQGSSFGDAIIDTSFSMMGMIAEFFFGEAPDFVSDAKQKEAYEKFRVHNLPPSCIPSFFGGNWDLQSGTIWEDQSYQSPAHQSPNLSTPAPSSPAASANTKPKTRRGRPPKVLSQECADEMKAECGDDAEFIKKRNALCT